MCTEGLTDASKKVGKVISKLYTGDTERSQLSKNMHVVSIHLSGDKAALPSSPFFYARPLCSAGAQMPSASLPFIRSPSLSLISSSRLSSCSSTTSAGLFFSIVFFFLLLKGRVRVSVSVYVWTCFLYILVRIKCTYEDRNIGGYGDIWLFSEKKKKDFFPPQTATFT